MKKRGAAIILVLCMLLSACGKADQGATAPDEENSATDGTQVQSDSAYTLTSIELADADRAVKPYVPENGRFLVEECKLVGETVYRFVRLQDAGLATTKYCLQKLEKPYDKWECQIIEADELIEGERCYINKMFFMEDGTVQLLLADLGSTAEEESTYYWAKWTENGLQKDSLTEITGEYMGEEFWMNGRYWYVDDELRSYHWINTEVKIYDANFESEELYDNKMRGIFHQILPFGDEIILCGNAASGGFHIWNAGTGEALYSTEDFEMMPDGQVMFAFDKEAYLYSLGKFYKLNLENGTYEMLVDVQDLGYFLTVLYGGGVGGNGLPMLLTEDEGELVLLELAKKPEGIAHQTVEIAMPFYTQKFEKLVADFERQNPEYDIILLDTHNDEGEEEFYAWKSRIMADISKGEGPDLIGTGMIPLDEAVEKGYLKDVTEWFTDDRDRIWSAAWESGKIDGRNYAVPYLCYISTMVTGEQFADGRDSWNLEELMQVYGQSGCQAIMTNMGYPWGENSGYFTMYYLGLESRSRGGLIDWENGVSHLKDESTVELLEYVKDNLYTGVPERYGEALASGEIMTCSMRFANIRDGMNAAVLFQDKEVYIGYPVEEGESGNLMSCESLAVNQGTENEEGVRAFLDYLISEKVQKKFAKTACDSSWLGSGFPVDKKSFEYVCDMMLEGEYIDGHTIGTHEIGGVVYEYNYVLTEESVEKVRRLFETAVPGNGSGIADNVLYEETEDFFNGNRSAQEVCDAMHNRVQLYLDEQK